MTVLDFHSAGALKLDFPDRRRRPGPAPEVLKARCDVVTAIAAAHAAAVDRDARFPEEAIAALRSQRLLGLLVPTEFGGEGASVGDVVNVCYALGRVCASTAMIYAMHQTKVACLVRHGRGQGWHERLLRRLASGQMLLASSTTEGNAGGNVRSSEAAIAHDGARITLERAATVISYGAQADGIVTTARRSDDAASSDQVLVTFLKEDYSLERTMEWETLGMRGTCSAGFMLRASGHADQILPEPYERIHVETMTPVAHLTWAGAWAGIAAGAVERARAFTRHAARRGGGQLPPAAAYLTKAAASLMTLRGIVSTGVRRFEQTAGDDRALASIEFQTAMNLTKVEASELAVATVMSAMRTCGLSGYRNDTEFSMGRHLRDILSSPIMINNDRILSSAGTATLMSGVPAFLTD